MENQILAHPLRGASRRLDTAEAKMIRAGVDLAFAARADNVTRAVLVVAQK
jgi:hypothetical protein